MWGAITGEGLRLFYNVLRHAAAVNEEMINRYLLGWGVPRRNTSLARSMDDERDSLDATTKMQGGLRFEMK